MEVLRRRVGPIIIYRCPFEWIDPNHPSLLLAAERFIWKKYNLHFLLWKKTYKYDAKPFVMHIAVPSVSEERFLEKMREYYRLVNLLPRPPRWEENPFRSCQDFL